MTQRKNKKDNCSSTSNQNLWKRVTKNKTIPILYRLTKSSKGGKENVNTNAKDYS